MRVDRHRLTNDEISKCDVFDTVVDNRQNLNQHQRRSADLRHRIVKNHRRLDSTLEENFLIINGNHRDFHLL